MNLSSWIISIYIQLVYNSNRITTTIVLSLIKLFNFFFFVVAKIPPPPPKPVIYLFALLFSSQIFNLSFLFALFLSRVKSIWLDTRVNLCFYFLLCIFSKHDLSRCTTCLLSFFSHEYLHFCLCHSERWVKVIWFK